MEKSGQFIKALVIVVVFMCEIAMADEYEQAEIYSDLRLQVLSLTIEQFFTALQKNTAVQSKALQSTAQVSAELGVVTLNG